MFVTAENETYFIAMQWHMGGDKLTLAYYSYRVAQEKPHNILLSISLLNIDRFSLFFHRHIQ